MEVTQKMLDLMHHTLGLRPSLRTPHRNHFVAGQGHSDTPHLDALVDAGMMEKRNAPKFCEPGDIVYSCTSMGKEYAIDNLPLPPKLTKYEEYLNSEYPESFHEYLGINRPKVEHDLHWKHGHRYRMFRLDSHYAAGDAVTGEWMPTQKEAKSSYKAALKKWKGQAA